MEPTRRFLYQWVAYHVSRGRCLNRRFSELGHRFGVGVVGVVDAIEDVGEAQAAAAIRMPGRSSWEKETYLPIDADVSLALYAELLDAADAGDVEAQERLGRSLEETVLAHAQQVSAQLIAPPLTTDFAVMFVPGEGAYAELMKRQALMEALQRDYHVMLTGPTTLTALLEIK